MKSAAKNWLVATDGDFATMSADLTLRGDNGYPMVFDTALVVRRQRTVAQSLFYDTAQENPDYADVIATMYEHLHDWARRMHQRTQLSEQDVRNMRGKSIAKGITLGMWDGSEWPEELQTAYKKRPVPDMRGGD